MAAENPRSGPSLRSVLAAALVLAASGPVRAAPALDAQEAAPDPTGVDTAAAADTAAQPPVPQTFDWWEARGVPGTTPWGQPVDTAATRRILSWTTRAEYVSPLVDHLPDGGAVVSPSGHFGHPVGRPGILHDVGEIYGYFEALAESSDRVRFGYLPGETEEGRRLALAQVGSETNLARLEEIRGGLNALGDPRTTTEAEAERLIADLPVVYTFYAGLHSPETGHPEMVMEMAYRLAVSGDPFIRDIREDAVVFIVPVAEPDGRDRVVQWHRKHNLDAYEREDVVPGPPYWGHYIYHDNNRDGLQMSLALTRILVDHALDWRYPIVHDLHESVPYLYTSTGTGPYNPQVDPITVGEWTWFANYEVTALTAYGLPGVWTHGFYSGWYPGYLMWVTANNLNGMGRFYETFGNSVPHTMERSVGGASSPEWYRMNPPHDSTLWSLRNNTNYMQTGALTALSMAADERERVLRQFWTKNRNSLRKGRTEAPHAWVVPADQPRRADAGYMLDLLRRHGVEVSRAEDGGRYASDATEDGSTDSVTVRAGDYLVPMDQPLRNYALTLMSRQDFPEDAPRPYDDVAWTFPLMSNVTAWAVDDSAVLALETSPVPEGRELRIEGSVAGEGGAAWYAVRHHGSGGSIRAFLALEGTATYAAEDSFRAGDRSFPPGTWLVSGRDAPPGAAERLASEHGMAVVGLDAEDVEEVARHELDPPRVALLHTWRNTQPDGSVRYALDVMGVPYDYIGVDDLRTDDGGPADLRSEYDVLLMAHQGSRASGRRIFEGVDPEWGPLPYRPSAEYPSLGRPDSTADATGGIGYAGMTALEDFVRRGGTFVTLGSASKLPVEMGMVRDVGTRSPDGLFIPGSILRGTVERERSPLAYGYEGTLPLYHQFGPYLRVDDDLEGSVVLRYGEEAGELLLSGLAQGSGALAGEPALVVAPLGDGHVVLFGFDPLHRFQNLGNFALVWNALMNWNDLAVGVEAAADEADPVEGWKAHGHWGGAGGQH